jgi:hypothetical protein
MTAWRELAEMGERGDDADRAVPALADDHDVVEMDHARRTGGILRRHEQGADDDVRAARLVDDRQAIAIELGAKASTPCREAAAAESFLLETGAFLLT